MVALSRSPVSPKAFWKISNHHEKEKICRFFALKCAILTFSQKIDAITCRSTSQNTKKIIFTREKRWKINFFCVFSSHIFLNLNLLKHNRKRHENNFFLLCGGQEILRRSCGNDAPKWSGVALDKQGGLGRALTGLRGWVWCTVKHCAACLR